MIVYASFFFADRTVFSTRAMFSVGPMEDSQVSFVVGVRGPERAGVRTIVYVEYIY